MRRLIAKIKDVLRQPDDFSLFIQQLSEWKPKAPIREVQAYRAGYKTTKEQLGIKNPYNSGTLFQAWEFGVDRALLDQHKDT